VTGNDWEIPIDRVEARVWLPEGVRDLHASVYTGPLGSKGQDARLVIEGREVEAISTRRLEPGEGLTLAVGFAKGLVTPQGPSVGPLGWLQGRLALLLPLLAGLILAPLWWLFGRDPALGAVPVVYEPPEGLPAAVLGALVRQEVGGITLGATLVDLAVKGHLKIGVVEVKRFFRPHDPTYAFTLRTPKAAWRDLAPHERYLLDHLFPAGVVGATVDTEDLRNSFYVHVPGFQALVRQAVLKQGFYRRWPATVRASTILGGFGVTVLVVGVARMVLPAGLLSLQMALNPALTVGCLVATGVFIIGFAWVMPSRTTRGVEVLRQTLGFEDFLRRVEAPRFKAVIRTPELFERFLPYAMVAGLTRQWAEAFQGILQAPPSWYTGHDSDFNVNTFGTHLEDCCRATSGAMQSSPSSSGGSSGGGSSGGGSGGGGGGGF
jgi:hypothetical protein